jgi:UDP-N-acetylglucosamine acyltransferase
VSRFQPETDAAMPIASSARVHPTAIVDPRADLGDEVEVGPHVVIEGEVQIGPRCSIGPGVHLFGPLTMGCHNVVHSYAVLGDRPQHLKYQGEQTGVEIGDGNIIREHVTIHRGTTESWVTRIGNHNFLMVNAHVGHDCKIGNHCLLANGAMLGGHVVVDDNAYLSGGCALHQFVHVGRLALLSGLSGSSKDIPPFIIQQSINVIMGVNVVGMRRAGIPARSIDGVRRAYQILFRRDNVMPVALAQVERELHVVPEVMELVRFIRSSKRGVCGSDDRAAAAA